MPTRAARWTTKGRPTGSSGTRSSAAPATDALWQSSSVGSERCRAGQRRVCDEADSRADHCTCSLGATLGPEAPLIALGGGLALLFSELARVPATAQSTVLLGTAGAAAAVSVIFGSPLVAAVMLMEVAGWAAHGSSPSCCPRCCRAGSVPSCSPASAAGPV
ncbi:chloride channel protein [Streptomyces europaeiscabiei]|uniref:chloride channel protein n=1 Tax=Streptomyces europaeiscabiei TaxID=146819 RepID=UPI0029C01226|nr:chloride channel protein [Streptomyces europaeiscabiei]